MKRNARTAYNALKKIGAPVLGPEKGWNGHFAISAELYGRDNGFYDGHIDQAPSGHPWADYYQGMYVDPAITDLLEVNGLHAEWWNAAILEVFDN